MGEPRQTFDLENDEEQKELMYDSLKFIGSRETLALSFREHQLLFWASSVTSSAQEIIAKEALQRSNDKCVDIGKVEQSLYGILMDFHYKGNERMKIGRLDEYEYWNRFDEDWIKKF